MISNKELIRFSGLSKNNFPACDLADLRDLELEAYRSCLSIELLNQLNLLLVDYSAVSAWSHLTTYAVGDLVSYDGTPFKALQASTNIVPADGLAWAYAPKFSTPCVEKFWCDYLARFISLFVIERQTPFIHFSLRAEGIVKLHGPNFDPVNGEELKLYGQAQNGRKSNALETLKWAATQPPFDSCEALSSLRYQPNACGCGPEETSCNTIDDYLFG